MMKSQVFVEANYDAEPWESKLGKQRKTTQGS